MNTTPFDLVIFDCDGVLVETEPLATQLFVQMFAEYGFQLSYEECLRKFAGAIISKRLEVTAQALNWTPPADFLSIFDQRIIPLTESELKTVPHNASIEA